MQAWPRLKFVGFLLVSLLCANPVVAKKNDVEFSAVYERIFQIRVVSLQAGGKSSIGSGFQVTADGRIATNYHVVSEFVMSPELYEIQYATHDGQTGTLELLDFDIISDLAVLQHPKAGTDFFNFSNATPFKGETAYALGNPGDWGIVLVPGPTNGLVEHSYEDQVLFSGSLNPGMSGGPSLNKHGEVIGVNVATAGNQLSFLVPVAKLERLLKRRTILTTEHYKAEIARQIRLWQQPRIQELIDAEWPPEEFHNRAVFGEIRKDFQCWGDTNESNNERDGEFAYKSCSAGDRIYISSEVNAGQIEFSFSRAKSIKLNPTQFARQQTVSMGADNDTNFENSTNFVCQTDFVKATSKALTGYNRVVTCVRAYKKYLGLFDSQLMVFSHTGDEVHRSYLSLSAVSEAQIQAFNRRFIEQAL